MSTVDSRWAASPKGAQPKQQNASPNAQFDALFKMFDRTLMQTLDKFGLRMTAACDKLNDKIEKCEKKLKRCFNTLLTNTTRDLDRKC